VRGLFSCSGSPGDRTSRGLSTCSRPRRPAQHDRRLDVGELGDISPDLGHRWIGESSLHGLGRSELEMSIIAYGAAELPIGTPSIRMTLAAFMTFIASGMWVDR
jgi:hypothetical protein